MRCKGKLATWNDDKGYGFIDPLSGGERVFAHVSVFKRSGRRPRGGDIVTFSLDTDVRGRPRASDATIAGVRAPAVRKQSNSRTEVLAIGFLLFLGGATATEFIPVPVLAIYLVASVITFGAYYWDKLAAKDGAWRTSERTLHLLALLGGWPGALVARKRLRHKSRKQPFRSVFWATVVLNCAVLAWLFTAEGASVIQSLVSSGP